MGLPLRNTRDTYGLIARLFHWLIALLILMLLVKGFAMGSIPFGPDKIWVMGLHKSLGITVLSLGALRLIWRSINAPPDHLHTHAWYERILAKTIHIVFYICMIGIPLSGWAMSSAGEYAVSFFGLFNLPPIAPKNHDLFETLRAVHELLAYGIIASILLHIAGAMKHEVIERDTTMKRMGASLPLAALAILFLATIPFLQKAEKTEIERTEIAKEEVDDSVNTDNWLIDHTASKIEFSFTQSGQAVASSFNKWNGHIVFDKDNLAVSRATITIDPASIETGSRDRNTQAQSADWFSVSEFPAIIFESESFTDLGSNRYQANGTLSIRDIKAPISFPFTLDFESLGQSRKRAVMNADLTLKRLDFGVGQGQWQATDTVADEVKIHLHVEADEKSAE